MNKYYPYFYCLMHCIVLIIIQHLVGYFSSNFLSYILIFQIVLVFYSRYFIKRTNHTLFLITYFLLYIILGISLDFMLLFYFMLGLSLCTIFISKYLTNKPLSVRNIVIITCICALSYATITYAFPEIREYLKYKEGYKNTPEPINLKITNESGESIVFEKDKIYVLDLWTTSCGICIQQFPDFYATSQKYTQNPKVQFRYVLVKDPKDHPNRYRKLFKKEKTPLDLWFVPSLEEAKKASIFTYPTLIIIKNSKIVYKGHSTYETNTRYNHIEDLINSQL